MSEREYRLSDDGHVLALREPSCASCAALRALLAEREKEIERLKGEHWAAVMNEEAGEEIASELFALCCAVVDGKPDATDARNKLLEHIKHVQECRQGSCATELGGTQTVRADAAEARVAALERHLMHTIACNGIDDECTGCTQAMAALRDGAGK